MAKISARGAAKVAQASKTWTDDDGYDHKLRLALRSDGVVLKAHDLRSPTMREGYGSRGWNRGGYTIVAKLSAGDRAAMFRGYAAKQGCELD